MEPDLSSPPPFLQPSLPEQLLPSACSGFFTILVLFLHLSSGVRRVVPCDLIIRAMWPIFERNFAMLGYYKATIKFFQR